MLILTYDAYGSLIFFSSLSGEVGLEINFT